MTDQLYQDRIVALAKAKTGAGKLASPTKSARRDNPLCGDRVTIDVRVDGQGKIAEIAHQVRGCLLCQASASALASVAVGRNAAGIEKIRLDDIDGPDRNIIKSVHLLLGLQSLRIALDDSIHLFSQYVFDPGHVPVCPRPLNLEELIRGCI